MNNKNFLNSLDDWGSILTDTYDNATDLIVWKEYTPTNNEFLNIKIKESSVKQTTGNIYGLSHGFTTNYTEAYDTTIKDVKVYFTFKNIIETSSYSNLTYGVLTGKIISNNRLTSTFEINYGYENKNPQAIDVSFMKLNKDNDIHINYYFIDTFLQRAITKINETRQPVNKIAEHILPAILKERNNRLKDIADG